MEKTLYILNCKLVLKDKHAVQSSSHGDLLLSTTDPLVPRKPTLASYLPIALPGLVVSSSSVLRHHSPSGRSPQTQGGTQECLVEIVRNCRGYISLTCICDKYTCVFVTKNTCVFVTIIPVYLLQIYLCICDKYTCVFVGNSFHVIFLLHIFQSWSQWDDCDRVWL